MERKYNLEKYDDYLASLMEEAYKQIEKTNHLGLGIALLIRKELRLQYKLGNISGEERDDIDEYFTEFTKK